MSFLRLNLKKIVLNFNSPLSILYIIFLLLILDSCAFDVIHIRQIPANIKSPQKKKAAFILERGIRIKINGFYSTELNKGTLWTYVGCIPQGDVYKTKDQILTVEASNIFEAYIVIHKGMLVGFYLPVEKSFSPIGKPVKLQIRYLKQ